MHCMMPVEFSKYLSLHSLNEADNDSFDKAQQLVSRVPPSGHPENQYVLSEDDAKTANYIKINKDTQEYEVQCDVYGTIRPPVVQPKKYQYLQQIAFRLGRDLRHLSKLLFSPCDSHDTRFQQHFEALRMTLHRMNELDTERTSENVNTKELSLTAIARDLLRYAPELLQDLGLDRHHDLSTITEAQAGQIIQFQLIEESNNNWEARFPEDEHVWDWVDDALPTRSQVMPPATASNVAPLGASNTTNPPRLLAASRKGFFSMRRWPVECQSRAVQTTIKSSGPTILENSGPTKTQALQRPTAQRELHTGKSDPQNFPLENFPFDEESSHFQQAHQSFRVDQDLVDGEYQYLYPIVPDSALPMASNSLWSRVGRKIKELEKQDEARDREKLKKRLGNYAHPRSIDRSALPGILSDWNPTNVPAAEKRWDKEIQERMEVTELIVNRAGRPLGQISRDEIREFPDEANIDPVTESVLPPPPSPELRRERTTMAQSVIDPTLVSGGVGQGDMAVTSLAPDRVHEALPQASAARNFRSRRGTGFSASPSSPRSTSKKRAATVVDDYATSPLRRKRTRS